MYNFVREKIVVGGKTDIRSHAFVIQFHSEEGWISIT